MKRTVAKETRAAVAWGAPANLSEGTRQPALHLAPRAAWRAAAHAAHAVYAEAALCAAMPQSLLTRMPLHTRSAT